MCRAQDKDQYWTAQSQVQNFRVLEQGANFFNVSSTTSSSKRNLFHEISCLVGYIASTVTFEAQPDDGTSPETSMSINILPELMEAQQCG
jgi:hypothetical protein